MINQINEKENGEKKNEEKEKTLVMNISEILSSIGWTDKSKPKWMKVVTGVDLSKLGGYALLGNFTGWSESVVIPPGSWVVLGGDAYALVRNIDGKLQRILAQPVIEQIKSELDPKTYANVRNSILYAYAVVIDYFSKKEGKNVEVKQKTIEEQFKPIQQGKLFKVILHNGISTIYADKYKILDVPEIVYLYMNERMVAAIHYSDIKEVIQ